RRYSDLKTRSPPMHDSPSLSRILTDFVHNLVYDDLSAEVVHMTKALYLDWLGSALAGASAAPVAALRGYTDSMGPGDCPAQALDSQSGTRAEFAAKL